MPDALVEYMGGATFIPFVTTMEKIYGKPKKGPSPPQFVPTPEQITEMDEGKTELAAYLKQVMPSDDL